MIILRYPDEVAGQIPMAYIVQKPGKKFTEDEIMDWVGKQVNPSFHQFIEEEVNLSAALLVALSLEPAKHCCMC